MIESQIQLSQHCCGREKNPAPVFSVPEDKRCLPFNEKLMKAASGFISSFDFSMHVAFSRSLGKRKRMPPPARRKALEALLQGICFHYDPLANRVSIAMTNLAIECGLATESKRGNLSITRATRAMKLLDLLGLITYHTEFNSDLGCNNPTDITLTPAFFDAIGISPEAVASARESRAAWKNKQRTAKGLPSLSLKELAEEAWLAFRNRFYNYRLRRKLQGEKRARARRDRERSRQEIIVIVRREVTRDIADGKIPASQESAFNEVQRRVKERMALRRNYTRLIAGSPGLA